MSTSSEGQPIDGVRDLLRFHRTIREHLRDLETLAADGRDHGWTAARLTGFFSGPLQWHDNDEELLLIPRLRGAVPAEKMATLDTVRQDHTKIENLLEALCPLLETVARGGAISDRFRTQVDEISRLLKAHLRREEETIFQLAHDHLSDDEREALGTELRRVKAARARSVNASGGTS